MILGSHLERLPAEDREAFVEDVLAQLDEPVRANYVRLNILARTSPVGAAPRSAAMAPNVARATATSVRGPPGVVTPGSASRTIRGRPQTGSRLVRKNAATA